ncbi:hypothetical protein Q8A64_16130 [Oxalobacteraceae bacterium R-40]|uniref:Uncharacterized protein n=1 Tax=Keguizhuia sedimenti TaxID=3064264 RepID=A0ABU1BSE4_9BURK|nr:hypothetical protein [Oxalobacteraceae bacterium R-40]
MNELQLNPMQPSKPTLKPHISDQDGLMDETTPEESASVESEAGNLLSDSLEQGKTLLNEHKGKLAIGVAATLGLMVFYKWREKKLAEEDPEEYARLQRIKAVVREQDAGGNKAVRADEDD